MANVSIFAALLAGMLSFLSPCVLPLVPPYLIYLTGTSLERFADAETKPHAGRQTIAAALLFVLGFSTVFVALGASASVIGAVLRAYSNELAIVAGIGIIVTFSVTYTPQSIPPAFMCMTNDGVSHNLFVATDPMFEAQISSIKTYNNSFNTSIYVTNPVIAMHPSDTKNLTVHVQQIVVLSSVSSVGWYVVEVPGLA